MNGGDRKGADMTNGGNKIEKLVRKSSEPMPTFDPQREKETYNRAGKEVLGQNWGASKSYVPHVGDRDVLEKPNGKVRTLTEFLRSCLETMKDEIVIITLYEMIDHCT
jgi:hypothetical protein